MLFGKKAAVTLSSMILLSAISACSSNVTPMAVSANGNANFSDSNLVTRISENVTQSKQDTNHFYIDAGHGKVTGASITVKLNLGNGNAFKTKSANGAGAAIAADVNALQVYLVHGLTGTPPSGALGGITTASGAIDTTSNATLTSQFSNVINSTITFINVDDNAANESYYVAVSAHTGTPVTAGNNITNTSPTIGATMSGTLGAAYLSTAGGAGAGTLASITVSTGLDTTVTPNRVAHLVSSTGNIGVGVMLADTSAGAILTSDAKIIDGSTQPVTGVALN